MLVLSYIHFLFLSFKEKMSMSTYYQEKPYLRHYSRAEVGKGYDKIEVRTTVCSKCKKCIN